MKLRDTSINYGYYVGLMCKAREYYLGGKPIRALIALTRASECADLAALLHDAEGEFEKWTNRCFWAERCTSVVLDELDPEPA